MAKINTLTEKEKDKFNITGKCDFCGAPSEYFWCADKCIEYCNASAVTLFPRMLADLVDVKHQDQPYHYPDQEQLIESIKATYWKSLAGKYQFELNKINSKRDNDIFEELG